MMNMIDRLVKPMDTDNYDYGTDSNMNDDNGLEESWKEFWRIWWNFPALSWQWWDINFTGFLVGLFPAEDICPA